MVDSPGKMLYNREDNRIAGAQSAQRKKGELAVKQKKTASMKQKFAYMAVTMVAASFGCFFMSVSGSQRHYGTDQADYG